MDPTTPHVHRTSEHRRRRLRRHGRRAYVRSVYFLPSLCTLGNAICGFAAIYICNLDKADIGHDPVTDWFFAHRFIAAAYMIFIAMLFDALDGRLARFTRHTTDFGGQLDSLADMVSFGVAPAILTLELVKQFLGDYDRHIPNMLSRLFWAVGALYMSCAAMRLARFNVSNQHGEQHHFSFLGLPSPGAAAVIAALILLQKDLEGDARSLLVTYPNTAAVLRSASIALAIIMPVALFFAGILMVSAIRYPHLVNRYLRGRKSIARVLGMVVLGLLIIVAHRYMLAVGCTLYALWGPFTWGWARFRRQHHTEPAPASPPVNPASRGDAQGR